jgi:two-component system, NtrC family, sensor kinase
VGKIETTDIFSLMDKVPGQLKGCMTLENAAQRMTELLYQELSGSVALVRLFGTVPFGKLPVTNRTVVQRLADSQGIAHLIHDESLVLSLLGTCGIKPAWNDRHQSQGHIGIPLVSAAFIDKIPMMSRLLNEVGLKLDWLDSLERVIETKIMAGLSGVFYVPDAQTAVDNQGRKIISAQDFVAASNIRSVFGLAGGYPVSKTFLTFIVFCLETVEKPDVQRFLPLIGSFKASTVSLVSKEAIFV